MDYYGQLQRPVSQVLKTNLDHFTEYDRKDLEQYKGAFILGIRKDGTTLCLLKPERYRKCSYTEAKTELDLYYNNLFENENVRFFYGKDGIVHSVIRSKVIEILREYARQAMTHFSTSQLVIKK